jgi:4-amino-4-deoxy-L-arabinose transferase-like glycosyltransferase
MRIAVLVAVVMLATVLLQAATTPTFDFDEALYRRIAEEMKQSHEYFVTTWDARPFYEKPPTYIWSIVAASYIVDGPSSHISVFASRLPSVLCSLLTVILLAWFWRRAAPDYATAFGTDPSPGRQWLTSPALPLLAYGTGLFAIGGAASVVLDPMLTLFLLVPLLIFSAVLLRNDSVVKLSGTEIFAAGFAMGGAIAVKGLIGIVLPALALALHAAISRRWSLLRAAVPPFTVAIASASIFFAILYQFTGASFFNEFFIRQHFVRATTTMQGHRGPLFFHVAIVLLLGGPLIAFVLRSIPNRSALAFGRWGFPLTWILTVIAFYSAMATKLPNYTWPVWPALVLTLCVLLMRAYATDARACVRRRSMAIAALACLLPIATLFLLLGAGVDQWIHPAYSPRAATIVAAIIPLPASVRLGLALTGIILAAQIVELRRFGLDVDERSPRAWHSMAGAAVLNCLALSVMSVLVIPFADRAVRGPLVRLSARATDQHMSGGDLITVGLFSPTVSSSYGGGPVRQVGRLTRSVGAGPGQHLVLLPRWQAADCEQTGFALIGTDEFLALCEKR